MIIHLPFEAINLGEGYTALYQWEWSNPLPRAQFILQSIEESKRNHLPTMQLYKYSRGMQPLASLDKSDSSRGIEFSYSRQV